MLNLREANSEKDASSEHIFLLKKMLNFWISSGTECYRFVCFTSILVPVVEYSSEVTFRVDILKFEVTF